jgi:hypothetical protein
MKIGVMQPYIFPYIGYFQLINSVDCFVIYDNIQYTKKGWINRNRILSNGKDEYFTLPLLKDSDYLSVMDRYLSADWQKEKNKLLNKIKENYRKAPYFSDVFELIDGCLSYKSTNLFDFIFNALNRTLDYLSVNTKIVVSSSLPIDHSLKAEEKVIAICKALHATTYINPIGGTELYSKEHFLKECIHLKFIKADNIQYKQFNNDFIPFLSIIDVMMFNSKTAITNYLNNSFSII